jgi:hypothetical protein
LDEQGRRDDCYIYQHKGREVARRSQDHAFDALLEQNDVEVDQKNGPSAGQPEIFSSCASWTGASASADFTSKDPDAVHRQIDAIPGLELDHETFEGAAMDLSDLGAFDPAAFCFASEAEPA